MAEKSLWKVGGNSGLGSMEVVDTDGVAGMKLNGTAIMGSALTTALTTITPADAEGTPDYAIAAITNSTAYGFASAQEAITVLYVIKNLQTRVAELESRLQTAGILPSS